MSRSVPFTHQRTETQEKGLNTELVEQLHSADFGRLLGNHLATLCRFDSLLIAIYHPDRAPIALYPHQRSEQSPSLKLYLAQSYRLDPLYQAIFEPNTAPLIRLEQLSCDAFQHSDYYRSCYKEFGLIDEINLLIPLEQNFRCTITLGRKPNLGPMPEREVQQIKQQQPMISALIQQHWRLRPELKQTTAEKDPSPIQQALQSFGSNTLTRREQQIAAMVLQGHCTKTIARKLDISPGTVKVHRKNIHARLRTSTQPELFARFLEHLEAS